MRFFIFRFTLTFNIQVKIGSFSSDDDEFLDGFAGIRL